MCCIDTRLALPFDSEGRDVPCYGGLFGFVCCYKSKFLGQCAFKSFQTFEDERIAALTPIPSTSPEEKVAEVSTDDAEQMVLKKDEDIKSSILGAAQAAGTSAKNARSGKADPEEANALCGVI